MALSRRAFLKLGIAGCSGAALMAAGRTIAGKVRTVDAFAEANLHRDFPEEWLPSVCNACPTTCRIYLRSIGREIVGVRPIRPRPCAKAYVIPQEIVHPDRVGTPRKRTGARGSGQWAPATVTGSMDGISRIVREAGPRVGLVVREDAGLSLALLKALFASLGAAVVATCEWPVLQGPLDALEEATRWGDWRYDLEHADGIISFGHDWLQSHEDPSGAQQAWRRLREEDLPSIYVGPRYGLTALRSEEWVPCRPGTESLVALGLLRLLVPEQIPSASAVDFAREVAKIDLEFVERTTGVSRRQLRSLAGAFRDHRLLALGMRGRIEDQGPIVSLNAILRLVGARGGLLPLPQLSLPTPVTEGTSEDLPGAIERGDVDTVVLVGVNPVFDSPFPARWRAALGSVGNVISFSSFENETAALSDWVLPLSLAAESQELYVEVRGEGPSTRVVRPAVRSESLSPSRIAFELASRLRPGGFPWKTLQEAAAAVRATPPDPQPFRFPEPRWTPPTLTKGEFHLLLESPAALARGHGAQHPYLLTTVGPHLREWWTTWMEIHPAAAARKGIGDRDWVEVQSESGAILARARTYEGIPEDAVCLPLGLGHEVGTFAQESGGNPAELLSFGPEGAPHLFAWNHTKVTLRKV